jgi:hypothetical protein
MGLNIVLTVFIAALLGYIIYLHKELSKRDIFIKTTVKRLSGIEKNRSVDEMILFLKEIQDLSKYSSYTQDKFLDDNTLKFILENGKNIKNYIHYTRDEKDARNILRSGFDFVDSFYKTALPVTKDKLDLKMKHNSRKMYGEFIVVICISTDLAYFYTSEIEKAGIKNYSFENVLTEIPPSKNENSDLVYQLAPQFIKGYVNHKTGLIVTNPFFDPAYNSPGFLKNIELLKS